MALDGRSETKDLEGVSDAMVGRTVAGPKTGGIPCGAANARPLLKIDVSEEVPL